VVARWDQLLRFAALQLSAEIGGDVDPVSPRGQTDTKTRRAALIDALVAEGRLIGALRIPNTAGDLIIEANLRSRRLSASLDVGAPQDKGAKGRVSWLVSQLGDAPGGIVIETYARNARVPSMATLDQTREDRMAPLDHDKKDPHRFRLVQRAEMGMGRSTGQRSPGFITTVLSILNDFYGNVMQEITPWQPSAPKLTKPMVLASPEDEREEIRDDPQVFNWPPVMASAEEE
jgi:hypothetical protein